MLLDGSESIGVLSEGGDLAVAVEEMGDEVERNSPNAFRLYEKAGKAKTKR